jgi:energy-coupling factor transporter ATP-binding protein EcfA2
MLVADGLSYRHAGALRPALREVDLTVDDGEVVGVVGANESGKSTLCLVLSGLAPRVIGGQLAGRVLLDGQDVAGLATHELAGRVGIVFDDPGTQLSGVALTVYEEVAFGPSNLAIGRGEVIDRTEAVLDRLGIRELAGRDPARLSGGQQQLVAIASILAMQPRHLILDEPTAQLDPAGTALVGEALQGLAASGVSVVLVEHKTDLVARLASRVVVLDGGRIALSGPAGDILSDPRLLELGVAAPGAVRLGRRLRERGVDTAEVLATIASSGLHVARGTPASSGPGS